MIDTASRHPAKQQRRLSVMERFANAEVARERAAIAAQVRKLYVWAIDGQFAVSLSDVLALLEKAK